MSKVKVLVVEDDEDLRYALGLRLRMSGYDVVEAGDGHSAVSVASRERPDVVLLDLGLPGGDGVSVLERYAQVAACRSIPVVVLTGRDPQKAAADVARFNVSALLTKPTDNDRLAEALTAAVEGSSRRRPRVLVVEDDDDLRRGLALSIGSWGYEVVQAEDGCTAVSVASAEAPDVVLLDLGLPRGDALWVLHHYARLPAVSRTPVVVLTGRDPETASVDVSPFHVWALLEKPLDNAQLADSLASALHPPLTPSAPGVG